MEYIAVDAHKRYTQVSVETVDGVRRDRGETTQPAATITSSRALRIYRASGLVQLRLYGLRIRTIYLASSPYNTPPAEPA